ncbi:TlpA disulfide reductase family protein [Peribacillus sp. CSMR9]|uniref:peroxiredoxin family protein n=1 Tax=Peribacillus sp. CSMR9 TaxID=2981350 RepID=UPI00295435DD|nr:TlpA disulfide reductase family protein [Peribacillus sp. CSMR9]MDV7767618.1 TlpA family protein disulfide reductase [Peribacillus sp. CSMR9]
MMKKVIAVVLLITLFTVAIVKAMENKIEPENTSQETANFKSFKMGSIAPDFELKKLSGETVTLSEFKGKKVILNFWATWCNPCKVEMTEIEKFHKKQGKDVVILAVNIDTNSDVKGFVKKNHITFPILLDSKNKVNELYPVFNIPTTFFIDSKGIVQNNYSGSMSVDIMENLSNKLN